MWFWYLLKCFCLWVLLLSHEKTTTRNTFSPLLWIKFSTSEKFQAEGRKNLANRIGVWNADFLQGKKLVNLVNLKHPKKAIFFLLSRSWNLNLFLCDFSNGKLRAFLKVQIDQKWILQFVSWKLKIFWRLGEFELDLIIFRWIVSELEDWNES